MDWFSFIAGALTGWIIEWLIDLFYWRRKQSRWANEHNRLQADLITRTEFGQRPAGTRSGAQPAAVDQPRRP